MQAVVRFVDRIHKIHSTEGEAFERIHVSGRRLTKIQTSTRPDHVWPEV